MGVSLRQFVRLFGCSPSKCVRHWASLFRPLCSSLVPDSRRSSSEPFLARPSCYCCFSVCHVRVSSLAVNTGPHQIVCGRSSIPSHARFWGLARWGHDPFPGGRAARHLGLSLSCVLCEAPSGDLFHCLSECPAFSDLRDQWCRQCSIHPDSVSFWARHPWLFLPSSSLNPVSSIRAMSRLLGRSASVSSHFDTLIPMRGSSPSLLRLCAFSSFPSLLLGSSSALAEVVLCFQFSSIFPRFSRWSSPLWGSGEVF